MRTRRSTRNQEILWRALGGKPEAPKPIDEIAMLEHFIADPFTSPRARRKAERDLAKLRALLAGAQ